MMLRCEILKPEDDPVEVLAKTVVEFIFQYGIPAEIRVSNVIVEAGLEQICDVCGIRLRRGKRLQGVEQFVQEMQQFWG